MHHPVNTELELNHHTSKALHSCHYSDCSLRSVLVFTAIIVLSFAYESRAKKFQMPKSDFIGRNKNVEMPVGSLTITFAIFYFSYKVLSNLYSQ